jgi:2-dehydropantoate 2-reductase
MTALTRSNTGVIRAVPETWRMYRLILEEVAAIGVRADAGLPADIVERMIAQAQSLAPETSTSLCHDLLSGKRLELEGLHGHAVRLGERFGVPTPMTSAVYAALKPWLMGAPEAPGATAGRRG